MAVKFLLYRFVLLGLVLFWGNVWIVKGEVCSPVPAADKGVLDLRSCDLTRQVVRLNGEWNFYWNYFIDPSFQQQPPFSGTMVEIPHSWEKLQVRGKMLPSSGYASYHLKILHNHSHQPLALKLFFISSAYSLYIDGDLVTFNGVIGKTAKSTVPQFRPHTVSFTPLSGQTDMVIHVSNFHTKKGGITRHINLGSQPLIQSQRDFKLGISMIIFGAILIIGLYHYVVYLTRPSILYSLYFCYFCLVIAVRIFVTDERFILELIPNLEFEWLMKLEYLSFYVGVLAFFAYVKSVFRTCFGRYSRNLIFSVGAFFSLLVLFQPVRVYSTHNYLYQIFTIIVALLVAYRVGKEAIVKKNADARFFISGFLIFFLTVLTDIIHYQTNSSQDILLVPGGVLFFVLMQILLLSRLFGRAFVKVKKLSYSLKKKSNELAKKNLELQCYNDHMEELVKERTEDLNQMLTEVDEAHRKITNSIEYSRLIQRSLLPTLSEIRHHVPEFFLIWRPKDIVGGDIFLVSKAQHKIIAAMVDCTGHGVPGAFMTMLVSSTFKQVISGIDNLKPSVILQELNVLIKNILHQNETACMADNGLDAALCLYDMVDRTVTFAGARMPVYYSQNNVIQKIKGDRQSIGYQKSKPSFQFQDHCLSYSEDMVIYLLTDGYVDQPGGEKGIGFGHQRLKKLLEKSCLLPLNQQETFLREQFEKYRGDYEIRDDCTLVGLSFKKFFSTPV